MSDDYFSRNDIKHIDYKDIKVLRNFTNPHGRLLARKRTGLTSKSQRKVENAVKKARFMGLMPFIER